MTDGEIATAIVAVANNKGGLVFVTDVEPGATDRALHLGWLVPVGIGNFELTDACPGWSTRNPRAVD